MEKFIYSNKVRNALDLKLPVVALESTVITLGLPRPTYLTTAAAMEEEVAAQNAT